MGQLGVPAVYRCFMCHPSQPESHRLVGLEPGPGPLVQRVAGQRIQLGTKEGLKVPEGEWHTLKVKMVGDHIECFLDGKKLLDVRDNTIAKAGQVGLWTKADAQTYFDNFAVIRGKK